jgi:hypothetical protein
MPHLSAEPIVITASHEQVLTRLVRAPTTPRKLAERAQMVLLAAAGTGVRESARQLVVWPKTVRHWLGRWRSAAEATPGVSAWPTRRVRVHRRHSHPSRSARLLHWPASNRRPKVICR